MDNTENKPKLKSPEDMTNWKNPPKLEDLKRDFEMCIPSHTKMTSNLTKWEVNFTADRLVKDTTRGAKKASTIVPRLIRKQAEWRSSALSEALQSSEDMFKVSPMSHEDRPRAYQNQLVLNHQFSTKLNRVKFTDEFVRTCVRTGTAAVKIGWHTKQVFRNETTYTYTYQPLPPDNEEMLQQFQELTMLMQNEPDTFAATVPEELQESIRMSLEQGQPILAVVADKTTKKVPVIVANHPTIQTANMRNLYVDPTCKGDLAKANFVVESMEISLANLKEDGRYTNLDHIDVESVSAYADPYHSYSIDSTVQFNDTARKKLTMYEYWGYWDINGDNTLTPIVAAWIGNVCIRLEESPAPDGKPPYVIVPYIPEPDSITGIPDGALLEDNQEILGALTRGVIDTFGKSANSQTGIAKGALDSSNLRRFNNGENYQFNPGANPQSQIYMHKFPDVPASVTWFINQLNNDAEAISGVKAFSGQGISGAGLGDTAAGVRSAMDAASKREMSILRRLADGIVEIGRKIMAMNAEFLTEEDVVRITNEPYIPFREDDLQGEFDLKLNVATAESKEVKAKELSFILQTLGNNLDPEMSNMILAEIANLRDMPDLSHKIRNYQPQPDPHTEELKKLELEQLKANIAKTYAEAQEKGSKATLHDVKQNVEDARADNLRTSADKNAQEFQKEHTGQRHMEELEKQAIAHDAELAKEALKGKGALDKTQTQLEADRTKNLDNHNLNLLQMKAAKDLEGTESPRQPISN